jgi:hypothetical protein
MRLKRFLGFVGLLTVAMTFIVSNCAQDNIASLSANTGTIRLTACVGSDSTTDTIRVYVADNINFIPVDGRSDAGTNPVDTSSYDFGDGTKSPKYAGLKVGIHSYSSTGVFVAVLTSITKDSDTIKSKIVVIVRPHGTVEPPDTVKKCSIDSVFILASCVKPSATVGKFDLVWGTHIDAVDCGCPTLRPFHHGYDNWSDAGVILLKSMQVSANGRLYLVPKSLYPGMYRVEIGKVWNGTDSTSTCLSPSEQIGNKWYDPVSKIMGFCLDYEGNLFTIADSAKTHYTAPYSVDSVFILTSSKPSTANNGRFDLTWGTHVNAVWCGVCPSLNPFQHGYDDWSNAAVNLLNSKSSNNRLFVVTKSLHPGVYNVEIGKVWNGSDASSVCLSVAEQTGNKWFNPKIGIMSFCLDYKGDVYPITDSANVIFADTTIPGTYGDDPGPYWNIRFSDYIHSNVAGGKDTAVMYVSLWNLDCRDSSVTMTSKITGLSNVTMVRPAGKRYAYIAIPVGSISPDSGAIFKYVQGVCAQTNHSGTKYWNTFYNAYQFWWVRTATASLAKTGVGSGHLISFRAQ